MTRAPGAGVHAAPAGVADRTATVHPVATSGRATRGSRRTGTLVRPVRGPAAIGRALVGPVAADPARIVPEAVGPLAADPVAADPVGIVPEAVDRVAVRPAAGAGAGSGLAAMTGLDRGRTAGRGMPRAGASI